MKIMEKGLFHELYKQLNDLDFRSFPPDSLSGFLHGYLAVYSMVRVYPWLEDDFGVPSAIHERAKEIARWYEVLVAKKDLPADTRAGYAADLMDVYQLYSDWTFLEKGLDAAYRVLAPRGDGKIVLPCRTPRVCRLLCNCYYFADDEACGELAGRLVTEALGQTRGSHSVDLLSWWDAICLYDDAVGMMGLPAEERSRLQVKVTQLENEKIASFRKSGGDGDLCLTAAVFHVLAKREFEACNEKFGIKR